MQGFLQSAKTRATEMVAEAEVAAKGLVATVEAAIDAPGEGSEVVVVPVTHGGPTGLQLIAQSDMPGEPVFVDLIAPGSPITASHPNVKEGSRLVAINMVRQLLFTSRAFECHKLRRPLKVVLVPRAANISSNTVVATAGTHRGAPTVCCAPDASA